MTKVTVATLEIAEQVSLLRRGSKVKLHLESLAEIERSAAKAGYEFIARSEADPLQVLPTELLDWVAYSHATETAINEQAGLENYTFGQSHNTVIAYINDLFGIGFELCAVKPDFSATNEILDSISHSGSFPLKSSLLYSEQGYMPPLVIETVNCDDEWKALRFELLFSLISALADLNVIHPVMCKGANNLDQALTLDPVRNNLSHARFIALYEHGGVSAKTKELMSAFLVKVPGFDLDVSAQQQPRIFVDHYYYCFTDAYVKFTVAEVTA